jgi:hypothetical protein
MRVLNVVGLPYWNQQESSLFVIIARLKEELRNKVPAPGILAMSGSIDK